MTIEAPLSAGPSPTVRSESEVLADLRFTFSTGRTRGIDWRTSQLTALITMLDEREADISAALAEDLGRSAAEAWLGDIASSRGEAVYARKHLRRWMRHRRQRLPLNQLPATGWVQYEPLGVVLIVAPWNYPVYLAIAPLIAAIAAGNCAVVKPSELAPAASALLARLIPRYLDSQAIVVVEGDGMTTQALLAAGFDHCLFTGGTEIGKKIMAGAAATLTPVTLELGGKSPVIVARDADITVAARRIAWLKVLNSGQTCIACDYAIVERPVLDEFLAKLTSTLTDYRSPQADKGLRIVNQRQFDRLVGYIESTQGEIVAGGRWDASQLTIEPTVIVNPDPHEGVMESEIFGPVLPIVVVDSLDEAVQFANARPKPLALYLFAQSKASQRYLVDSIPSGGAVINHIAMHCLVPALPFGGVGASGMGDYHGQWGFETFSHRKAVLSKTARPDLTILYPPYTTRSLNVMKKLF